MDDQFSLTWVIPPSLLCQGWMANPDKYPVWGGHKGYDFQLTFKPVPAFFDCEIIATGFEKSWGNFAWGMHSDKKHKAIYAHFSEIKVKKGQEIKRNDILGISGDTGSTWRADGSKEPFAHLHFGLQELVRGVWSWVNPGPYFAARTGGALVPDVYAPKPLKAGQTRLLQDMNLRADATTEATIIALVKARQMIEIEAVPFMWRGIQWRKVIIRGWMAEREGDTVYLEQEV